MTSRSTRRATLLAAIAATFACGGSDGPTTPDYDPDIPAQWAAAVTNTFFPLTPGTVWEFSGETAEGTETVTVEVLDETRTIQGVTATIVRDRVFLDGDLIEDTFDWYAQNAAGNVWYLGEDSKEIENGQVVNTDGSWEWGADGALPGIVMWADPAAHLNEEYRQEYYEGEAEDFGEVLATGESLTVPAGSFTGCVRTSDRNALEPGPLEHKTYCPGVGLVLEVAIGSGERVELVGTSP